MRKKRRQRVTLTLLIGIVVFIVILNVIDQSNIVSGNWTVITASLMTYLAPLIGIGLGITIMLRDVGNYSTTPMRIMLMTSIIGVCISWLFFELNTDGIWIDEIVTATFTITDLQIVIVMFSMIFGIIIGLIKR